MAVTLSLFKGWLAGGLSVMDLLSTSGLKLLSGGWSVRTGGIEDTVVWDVFELTSRAASAATNLSNIYTLQKFITDARRYHEGKSPDPCWIRAEPTSGFAVHSLVYDGTIEVMSNGKWGPLLNADGKGFIRVALAHNVAWENFTAQTVTTTLLDVLGGKWSPTVTSGDLDGRITELKAYGHATKHLDDFWIGVRNEEDVAGTFQPLWEAESGALGTDAVVAGHGTASGGSRVTVSFATVATMTRRWYMTVAIRAGGLTNCKDYAGSYLVLGRMGCSGVGSTFVFNLYQGLSGIASQQEMVGETSFTPTAATYQLIELGHIKIPSIGYKNYADFNAICGRCGIYLSAARTVGTDNLYFDCVILVPTYVLITAKGCLIDSTTEYLFVTSEPTGETTAVAKDGVYPDAYPEYGVSGHLIWPRDANVLVLAAQQTGFSDLATNVSTISVSIAPRYSLYRNA